MKSSTKVKMSTKSGLKGLPKTRGETTITVRNDVNGDTMMTNDFIRVDTSQFLDFVVFTNVEEVSGFGQTVDDQPNPIMAR
ncbi:hypothetical protein HanIR_Chr07g0304361 [Helianthus annuus]|nr:hypothetical protein HanIR_Chr07g0304361 [Helianthus annuus]